MSNTVIHRLKKKSKSKPALKWIWLFVGASIGFSFAMLCHLQLSYVRIEPGRAQLENVGTPSLRSPLLRGETEISDGWNTIHVFTGNSSHLVDASTIPEDYYKKSHWFSQARQDEIVYTLLNNKQNGFFIDLAANDAVRISNTFALERDHGWHGLCIEPNPVYWSSLAYREHCTTVAAVIGDTRMEEVTFKFPNRAAPKGGIVGPSFRNHDASKFGEDHKRFTVTIQEILSRFNAPKTIDYLSLDVEGAEYFIMKEFPFRDYTISVLTIEDPSDELQQLLISQGYTMLQRIKRIDSLWVHKSMLDSVNRAALDIDTINYRYSEK